MIPDDLPKHKPEIAPLVPLDGAELAFPDNDPGPAPPCCVCPTCGHTHRAYDQAGSALLDCLAVILDATQAAKAIVEEEVLP